MRTFPVDSGSRFTTSRFSFREIHLEGSVDTASHVAFWTSQLAHLLLYLPARMVKLRVKLMNNFLFNRAPKAQTGQFDSVANNWKRGTRYCNQALRGLFVTCIFAWKKNSLGAMEPFVIDSNHVAWLWRNWWKKTQKQRSCRWTLPSVLLSYVSLYKCAAGHVIQNQL